MFAAATYAKTQEEMNRNPYGCFPFLQKIPKVVYQPDSHEGPHPHVRVQGVKVKLSQPHQTIFLSINLTAHIVSISGSDEHHYRCTIYRYTSFMGLFRRRVPYATTCTCHGEASRQQTRTIEANLPLANLEPASWSISAVIEDIPSPCAEYDRHIQNVDFGETFERIRSEIMNNMTHWHQDLILSSHVDLGLGARAFLHFPKPKIRSNRGKSFFAGSVHACIESNSTWYAVSAEKRGIRQCQTRPPIFRIFRSKDQIYDFRKVGAEAAKPGTSSLVFSWQDSSHVAMKLVVGSVTVEARLTELVGKNETSFLLSVTCRKCTRGDGTRPVSQIPPWMSYLPRRVRQYIRPAQPTQDRAVNATQPGGAQGSWFWVLADNSTQMVSIGRGSIPGKDEVLSLQIKGVGSLAHQFGLSKGIWNVSSGMARHFCTPSIPASLSADGHGTIRLSTSLLEGLFWARSQQLMAYASNTSRNVLDAVLRNELQVGKMQFTVDTDTASSSGESPLLWLSVAGARVRTSCPSRQDPLFAASLHHMRSAVTAQARKKADGGSLAISVAAQTGEHAAPDVSDFRLQNPRVPMDDSVPTFLLTDVVQAMNKRLEHITLYIPRELAQFIPCPMIKGKCRNMELHLLSKQEDAGGYLEFIDTEVAAAETFAAEQPKLASSTDNHKDEGIITSPIACILFLLWLWNLGLSVWTSWEWVVSSVTLSVLCLAWHLTGPFAGCTESRFSDFGISKQDAPTDVIECMQRCNYAAVAVTYVSAIWPLVIATVRRVRHLLSVVVFAARAAEVPGSLTKLFEASTEETVLGHILFSALVCVSQLAFIIVIPLRVNLGKQVALHVASSSENWYPGTAVDIIKAVLGNSDLDIHRATGAFVSCSFTALYVSHLGLYLIFFLLALSPGFSLELWYSRPCIGASAGCEEWWTCQHRSS